MLEKRGDSHRIRRRFDAGHDDPFGREGITPLQVGDILMKLYYGGAVHGLIAWGQRFHKAGNATDDYVHAAIVIGPGLIAESIGGGIKATRLMQQGKPYVYNVYRYGDGDIAGIAGAVAEGWLSIRAGQHGRDQVPGSFGDYAYGGAVGAAIQNIGSQPSYKPGGDLWGSGGKPGIGTTYSSWWPPFRRPAPRASRPRCRSASPRTGQPPRCSTTPC